MERHLRMALFLLCLVILNAATLENDQTEEEPERSWEKNFIIPHVYSEMTSDDGSGKPRVSLCCRVNTFLAGDDCVQAVTNETEVVQLPAVYETNLVLANITASVQHFNFVIWNPCVGRNRYPLNPHVYLDEKWYLMSNGSILRPLAEEEHILEYHQYCLARVKSYEYQEYLVFFCEETYSIEDDDGGVVYSFGMLVSVPFLAATYVVYWLLPDLKNLHGLTLRGYVGCLAMAYSVVGILQLTPQEQILTGVCITLGISTE
ncbi:G-protein coupled receptor Mth2-like [Anoplolepis gracilipes]|uniref:G-protein coupled receptor Mth2-like n=1 Tax=Anoplolepis gracilipes TaxID=354296 RepID=UPI003BA32C09